MGCKPNESLELLVRSTGMSSAKRIELDESAGPAARLTLLFTRASEIAMAIARPSRVLVPLPSSSTIALQAC